MKLTRRELLGTAAAGLALGTLAGCSTSCDKPAPQPDPKEGAKANPTGTIVMFRGLTLLATTEPSVNPPRAAVVLVSPKGIVMTMNGKSHTLPEHSSVLKVPLGAALDTTTAPHIKDDQSHRHYSLDQKNVSFTIRSSKERGAADVRQPALPVNYGQRTAAHPCGVSTASEANGTDWLLDIRTELVPARHAQSADLDPNWRRSPYAQAIVDLPFGSLEDATLNNAGQEAGGTDLRQWEIAVSTASPKPIRGFKEGARHLFAGGGFLHITLTDRTSGDATHIVVDNTPRQILEIEQLPTVAGHQESNSMEDLIANLGLLEGTLLDECKDGSCLPVYKNKRSCGGFARGCNCCGGTRIKSARV